MTARRAGCAPIFLPKVHAAAKLATQVRIPPPAPQASHFTGRGVRGTPRAQEGDPPPRRLTRPRRPFPAAGLFFTLTRRCPLACAHCSTNSALSSEQYPAAPFERLTDTFTTADRPDLLSFTGGEPLLRPGLVRALAARSREAGTASTMITGGYFARDTGRVSSALWSALTAVDHVTFSLDIFHERQVPRRAVFAVVHRLLEAGQAVSFQVVGTGSADPYLAEVTGDIRRTFCDAVPALVVYLRAVGRATQLLDRPPPRCPARVADPCTMAGWPTVAFDGTVVACCNQTVVDGPAPPHLQLGHAAEMTWAPIAARVRDEPILRAAGLRAAVPGRRRRAGKAGRLLPKLLPPARTPRRAGRSAEADDHADIRDRRTAGDRSAGNGRRARVRRRVRHQGICPHGDARQPRTDPGMGKLTLDEIVRARDTPGRSLLLFLTDRCPVGCAHCSVDSRRDSPSISDHALLAELVAAICADSERQVIGISGGEPFVERRGLSLAVDALAGAGKDVVVYTSGVWARGGESPAWIRAVLRAASCVFLSTDAFHAASIGEQRFVSAARSIAAEGTPLVVQVMDLQDQVGAARRLLGLAFGADWPAQAELSLTPSLPYGRGAEVFALAPLRSVPTLGRCPALSAPVVR